jgi:hypothetical protein
MQLVVRGEFEGHHLKIPIYKKPLIRGLSKLEEKTTLKQQVRPYSLSSKFIFALQ